MKKVITALMLTLAFSAPIFADGITPVTGAAGDIPIVGRDGNTPHSDYAGCEGSLWYPDSRVCCIPGQECPANRSGPSNNTKTIF